MADVKGKMPFFVSKTNPVTVTGLQASTSYNFQLVVYDKNENSTVWEEPITFKTLPATPILKNFQLQLIKPTSEFIKATFNVTTTDKITKAVINSDLNNSNTIEKNEAIYLALALSLDSICVGISSSSFGLPSLFFPILVPLFQLFFINAGIFLGKKIIISNSVSLKFWNFLSGILLIFIGFLRIIL